ncbi:MAG: penicillin-binding protein [Deltaproteobacteria bacterium]|nr:MAG: penicillin-binding protein [Deltaproteobacteria bacterium]
MKKAVLMIIPCLALACLLVGVGTYLYFSFTLPPIKSLEDYKPSIITQVFSDDGELIGEFYREYRIVVPIERIPKILSQAFVAAEDAKFYQHKGISYLGILRAIAKNIMAGRIIQGGSTITQQVVRSLLLTRERTLSRKIREILLAHRIEKYLTKEEILYIYLNQIYLGHGNYGVEAAARDYFGKGVEELNLAEAALLAGLPRAPEKYSPLHHLPQAKKRQAYVLGRMVEDGYITKEEAEQAYQAPLEIKARKNKYLNVAPYFTEFIRMYLQEKYGEDLLYNQGLRVYTTLDLKMQQAAQEALQKGLRALDKRQGYRGPDMVLKKDEIAAFCQEMAKKLLKSPITVGKTYLGVVTGISKAKKRVWVRIGEVRGYIPFETMRWARSPNPEVDYKAAILKDPSGVLKVGYVIQTKVKDILPKGLLKLELEQEPEVQGAILSIELPTGYVRAMVGGRNFLQSQFNRALQAHRQPGSAFKPIIYAAALDKGFTPASIIIDSPVIYYDALKGDNWKPKNFEERFYGPTTLRTALTHSRNVVTIKLLRDIGIPYAIEYARKLGIESPLAPNLSLALGSSEVTLLELVRAYAVFAARGHLIKPIFIKKILDRDGNILEENHPLPLEEDLKTEEGDIVEEDLKGEQEGFYPQVISAQTSYIMTNLLEGVIKNGTGWRARGLGRPCAGKTGTTNEYTDAWFVGYTPDLITGVWVGFDEKKPLGRFETGSRAASPIWVSFMKKALEAKPVKNFPIPEGIVFAKIDPTTGLLAPPGEKEAIFECFKEGTQPTTFASEASSTQIEDFLKSDTLLQEE